jgi:SlyX protein
MNEAETASRIVALEVRVAHQDRVIEDLNALVTEQWKQIDALAKQVERMTDRLQRVEENSPSSDAPEPPPPHY